MNYSFIYTHALYVQLIQNLISRITISNKSKQYRQCTYNVAMRDVFVTDFEAEKQKVLHILSVCW